MKSDPLPLEEQQPADTAVRESRLLDIRREAERTARVEGTGIRPAGAPFPLASSESGYHGIPLLKEPPWTWQIPLYFFVGGAAGSAAVIGLAARWVGKDLEIASDCRLIAATGTALSTALLIADLGRPARFLAMMRIFKPQSPMSIGAWTLAVFGTASAASAFTQRWKPRYGSAWLARVGNVAEAISALAGLPFSNYTGVLIGASVIPVWNENVRTLPLHFGMSGLNSAVSILELMGHDNRALNSLGIGACAIESMEGISIETRRMPALEPLKRGGSGTATRLGGLLSGPVPLALRMAALFAKKRQARQLRKLAAITSIAGSLLTRFAWVHAGHVSARDWRLPLEMSNSTKLAPARSPGGSLQSKA
jgi:formate-dependent nitrite reductase membrane component NrfD